MTDIVWEDPPTKSRYGAWAERLAPLRERPGEWAKFGKANSSTVTNINRGRLSGITAGDYEARGVDQQRNGECTLYVRYLGKGGDE